MITELKSLLPNVPGLLKSNAWDSLLIDRFPPVIHRLSLRLSENRTLLLHKLFNTGDAQALMHSHSWDFACKVLFGEYEMGVGYSEDRNKPPTSVFTSFVREGEVYEILSPNIWHYTKPTRTTPFSCSVMLIGPKHRARQAMNNSPLSPAQRDDVLDWFSNYMVRSPYVRLVQK